jgi:hypothetical protein
VGGSVIAIILAQQSLPLNRARSSLDDGPIGTSQTTDANVVVGYTESEYMEWQEQHRKHQAIISEYQALQERLQLFRRVWDEVHDFLTDSAGIVFDDNGAAFDNNGVAIYNDYHRGCGQDGHLPKLRETLTLLEAEQARLLQDRFAYICRILSRCPNMDGLSHIPRAAASDLSSLRPSSFPIGYAKTLGRALKIARQNAVPVPSLTVHVDRLMHQRQETGLDRWFDTSKRQERHCDACIWSMLYTLKMMTTTRSTT